MKMFFGGFTSSQYGGDRPPSIHLDLENRPVIHIWMVGNWSALIQEVIRGPRLTTNEYSSFFSSAMPMSDSPRTASPGTGQTPTFNVIFLAASVYEFNIDRARSKAGYPYLTYVAGEVSTRVISRSFGAVLTHLEDFRCHWWKGRALACKEPRRLRQPGWLDIGAWWVGWACSLCIWMPFGRWNWASVLGEHVTILTILPFHPLN